MTESASAASAGTGHASAVSEGVATAVASLDSFCRAGVLVAADVHVARVLGRLCDVEDPDVLLAAALAVRGPRFGHTCVDLTAVRDTVAPEEDAELPHEDLVWPNPEAWVADVGSSPMVGDGRPLQLGGSLLYLDRSWRAERLVASALLARAGTVVADVDEAALDHCLGELDDPDKRRAAEVAVRRGLAVIGGGPGTGKTYTIKAILGLLAHQAEALGVSAPRIALVAPTGKAAQRVTESVADDDFTASTIHKLLRPRPDNATRFRHDSANPLPYDVVIVDETSMVSLDLMAKLLDAVRPDARLVLVGDPDQLTSVESGAVLGDVVGPAREVAPPSGPLSDSIVVLRGGRRFGGGIADLATAIQAGDAATTVSLLGADLPDVRWLPLDVADEDVVAELGPVRSVVTAAGDVMLAAAGRGDGLAAVQTLERVRVLCAHRRGNYGVQRWVERITQWLSDDVAGFDAAESWYVGRPVLVTANDYQLNVRNGDTGVTIVRDDGRLTVAFPKANDEVRHIAPHRLDAVQTVHAMTIHKSQGSQFDDVVVVLPDPSSRILSRELLYTAVTRAKISVTVVGTEAAIRAGVQRRVQRASGLREALWS